MDQGITKAAARLRWGVFATIAVMLVLYVAARFDLQFGGAHIEYRLHEDSPGVGRMVGIGTVSLLLVALLRLTQMLRLIQTGELFSVEVIRRFRSFAWWLLLLALFGLVAPTLLAFFNVAATGSHQLAFVLDFRQLLTLGITVLLFLLARLLERAREIEAEMREIV
ncbi:DUF2975 domain-containing protein [Sphingomonas sp.]|uniref:DUF2975 domain-containing protein n=1 Tax=Sphingomonas sp. TaxID=28214 RepID=UPI00286CD768|nr:DUF2975 domain-containing protein [Sphingomonas sp.]